MAWPTAASIAALALAGCAETASPPRGATASPTSERAVASAAAPGAPSAGPVSSAPDTSPPPSPAAAAPAAPAPPPLLDLDATGCFAWSPTELTAACMDSHSSIAQGCHDRLVFVGKTPVTRHPTLEVPPQCLGDHQEQLDPAARPAIEARLNASFVRIGEPAAVLSPGKKADVGSATVELVRRVVDHVSLVDGAWDVYADDVVVHCRAGGKKAATAAGGPRISVLRVRVENALDPHVTVVETGSPWLLVWYAATWGFEGDMGGRVDVMAVDRDRCIVVRP